jgi:two-component system, LytTR family, response regulator
MINCIVIEDEPLAIEKLVNYISKLTILNLLATFNSGIDAIGFIKKNKVDLIFLDIEMKELTGIQFLESITTKSKIIITTAYEKYAIKGFELQVSDYLLKPISFERFVKACDKANEELIRDKNYKSETKIFIKTEYRLEGIEISSILYIEGMGDYRRIITEKQKIMTLQTFKELLYELPKDKFFRVHNSYAVAIDKIEKIERNRIKIGDKLIPISDSNSEVFYKKIGKSKQNG